MVVEEGKVTSNGPKTTDMNHQEDDEGVTATGPHNHFGHVKGGGVGVKNGGVTTVNRHAVIITIVDTALLREIAGVHARWIATIIVIVCRRPWSGFPLDTPIHRGHQEQLPMDLVK